MRALLRLAVAAALLATLAGGEEDSATDVAHVEAAILALYTQHNPSKVSAVPGLMAKYAGSEEELLATIREKYSAASDAPPTAAEVHLHGLADSEVTEPKHAAPTAADVHLAEVAHIKAMIIALYTQHNPSKVGAVPGLMAKYAGIEEELLATIREKYATAEASEPTAEGVPDGTEAIAVAKAKGRKGRRKSKKGGQHQEMEASGGLREGEQVCVGPSLNTDIWHTDEVQRVLEPGANNSLGLFEVVPGKRVMLLPGSLWIPQYNCENWFPIGSASHLPVNAYKCEYPKAVGDGMLKAWWEKYGERLREAFGVVSCEHRSAENNGGKQKAYATVGNRELELDDLHADGCPSDPHIATDPLWAADCASDEGLCKIHLTTLSYPHNRWEGSWGGHTEWAARKCGDPEDVNRELGQKTPAALRVAPVGDRTVVFNGGLLHRATHPEAHAGVAQTGQREGLRFSMVMQLVCRTHGNG